MTSMRSRLGTTATERPWRSIHFKAIDSVAGGGRTTTASLGDELKGSLYSAGHSPCLFTAVQPQARISASSPPGAAAQERNSTARAPSVRAMTEVARQMASPELVMPT